MNTYDLLLFALCMALGFFSMLCVFVAIYFEASTEFPAPGYSRSAPPSELSGSREPSTGEA